MSTEAICDKCGQIKPLWTKTASFGCFDSCEHWTGEVLGKTYHIAKFSFFGCWLMGQRFWTLDGAKARAVEHACMTWEVTK